MRKAQSTLEYVIILTAIIGVILILAGGVFRDRLQGALDHVSTQMDTQVRRINY